jgi:hypothetical protein
VVYRSRHGTGTRGYRSESGIADDPRI